MAYPIARRILTPIANIWIGDVTGLENIPKNKPFIIASNHTSYMDHVIIGFTLVPYLKKKVHFLSKKEHFEGFFLKVAWHTYAGAIPLDREKGGKKALRWAIKALKSGKIIAIHPEGTRSLNGKMIKGKTGTVRLALAAKVPIIPAGIIGAFEILPKGKKIPKMKRMKMNIGKPIKLDKYYNKKVTKKMLDDATKNLMKQIAKLSNQKYNH